MGDAVPARSKATRNHHPFDAACVRFEASYRPTGAGYRSVPGTLDHWLTDQLLA
jgi:hypothetical protein